MNKQALKAGLILLFSCLCSKSKIICPSLQHVSPPNLPAAVCLRPRRLYSSSRRTSLVLQSNEAPQNSFLHLAPQCRCWENISNAGRLSTLSHLRGINLQTLAGGPGEGEGCARYLVNTSKYLNIKISPGSRERVRLESKNALKP